MDAMPLNVDNRSLSRIRDLYENTLTTHRGLYSFGLDLMVPLIHIIPYYSQWHSIMQTFDTSSDHTVHSGSECVIIGLCFRSFPRMQTLNIRDTLQSVIYTRSNNKAWCNALSVILDLLHEAVGAKGDHEDECGNDGVWDSKLRRIIGEFPTKYEKLGDCLLFPSTFGSILKEIKSILDAPRCTKVYGTICRYLKCEQIGLQRSVGMLGC